MDDAAALLRLADVAPVGIACFDAELRCLYRNARCPIDHPGLLAVARQALSAPEQSAEEEITGDQGTRLAHAFAHADGVLLLVTDAADRLARRDAELRFRAFMENSPLAALIVDCQDQIVYSSERMPASVDQVGAPMGDPLPPKYIPTHREAMHRARETGQPQSLTAPRSGRRERDGGWYQTHYFPLPDGYVGAVSLDVTELVHTQHALRAVAREEAALRRVATLVAAEAPEDVVFATVTEEVARLLGAQTANTVRFLSGLEGIVLGGWSEPGVASMPVGAIVVADSQTAMAAVLRTSRPARIDSYEGIPGQLAAQLRSMGLKSSVAAPILLQGKLWGMVTASTTRDEPMPPDSEERIGHFAELVAQSLANSDARRELAASRKRLVAAADAARRRLERDLHDGAQQRILGQLLRLRLVRRGLDADPHEAAGLLDECIADLELAVDELRELARGIHPTLLSRAGLPAAVRGLIGSSTIPARLTAKIDRRLPAEVEAALYFVCAESLTNVGRHAGANAVEISLSDSGEQVVLEVVDDGLGGAEVRPGGGLEGLRDRIEALGGRFEIAAGVTGGTLLRATLPTAKSVAGH
jgi:signal transduction histidine kinase